MVRVIKEEKIKGSNLIGVQFCNREEELLQTGIITYAGSEYYCLRGKL